MKKFCFLLFTLSLSFLHCQGSENELSFQPDAAPESHILYLMHIGETAKALQEYQNYHTQTQSHDFELIEKIATILLDQGWKSDDPEIQLLTLFGAGISANEKTLYILEEGTNCSQPELQLIALNLLSRYQNDHADVCLHRAMSSNHLLIRLEAAFQLAENKDPRALGQIEALMAKVDEDLWTLFAELYALVGTPQAKKNLRKLLTHDDEAVRIAAILSIAENEHDDFLPVIRRLSSHHGPAQQEACATALGHLKDQSSCSLLTGLLKSPHQNVQVAALKALYKLGRVEFKEKMELLAKKNDLCAIASLGLMKGSEDVLAALLTSSNPHVQLNAAFALLELGDSRCLPIIYRVLLRNASDIAFLKSHSQGESLTYLRAVPCAKQNLKDTPLALEISLHIREAALLHAMELPEKDFLALADALFESQQNDLVPTLASLLENHPTQAAITLLKKHQQKAGAPLIRNYCNLVLYRLKQPGPYGDNLRQWVAHQQNIDLIRFRPTLPLDLRDKTSAFQLTPQETSRLLIEAFESFVSTQDDKGVDTLISIIKTGNSKNKYALIGLLMRAIQ